MRIMDMITQCKMNLLHVLLTSPLYFCRKWIGAINENSNFDLRIFKGLRIHVIRYYFNSYIYRASDISRGRGPAKFTYFREIPWNSQKNGKYREIHQKYFQIHVGKTYLILILAIRPVLFTPNVQIYLETSSLQWVNNVPKLSGVFRWMLRKTGH